MSKSKQEAFAKKLASLMQEKMLSQGDLASLVGVSTATVWGWLNGSIPQRRTAEVLCQKLDVSRVWLITGLGAKTGYIGNPKSADFYLSLLEKYEEVDSITLKNETATEVYRKVAKDLRKLADSLNKKSTASAASAVIKLAIRYEQIKIESNEEIRAHALDLIRRQRGAGLLKGK